MLSTYFKKKLYLYPPFKVMKPPVRNFISNRLETCDFFGFFIN